MHVSPTAFWENFAVSKDAPELSTLWHDMPLVRCALRGPFDAAKLYPVAWYGFCAEKASHAQTRTRMRRFILPYSPDVPWLCGVVWFGPAALSSF